MGPLRSIVMLAALAGCSPQLATSISDDNADTGYYSDLVVEVEGVFRSTLVLHEDQLLRGSDETQDELLARRIEEHMRMAKNQFAEQGLHLNLVLNAPSIDSLVTRAGETTVEYSGRIEILVARTSLEGDWQDFVGLRFDAELPMRTHQLYMQGVNCAKDYEDEEGYLTEGNYFYYFYPKSECQVELSATSYTIETVSGNEEVFPEYDRLLDDNQIDAMIIFGEANDPWNDSDDGNINFRTFTAHLRSIEDFTQMESLSYGERYQRIRDGIRENVVVVSPKVMSQMEQDGSGVDELFRLALQEYEIISYNGHSFYGALDSLDKVENYVEDKYQVIFMNSCWSYEYYTKQVFANKATSRDPSGWSDVDVVNNTQTGRFTKMESESMILLRSVLDGAKGDGIDEQGRRISWQKIIQRMNRHAMGLCSEDAGREDCAGQRIEKKHEIYGVSGVQTNQFMP